MDYINNIAVFQQFCIYYLDSRMDDGLALLFSVTCQKLLTVLSVLHDIEDSRTFTTNIHPLNIISCAYSVVSYNEPF